MFVFYAKSSEGIEIKRVRIIARSFKDANFLAGFCSYWDVKINPYSI